jgi:hypothetical protein
VSGLAALRRIRRSRGLVGRFRRLRRGLTPVLGTIYRIRAYHPITGRLMHRAYFGQTRQVPWDERIEGHLWGTFDTPAQPWADTVPGWRPNGTVDEVIAAGGATVVCQFRTVRAILTVLEILTIRYGLPVYNDQHNRGNPRRIPKWLAVEQRRERDARRGLQPWGALTGRWGIPVRQLVGALLLVAGVLVVLLVTLAAAM